ncbi:ATP-binding protein [Streptomyces longispororuber]|uniref:ATP-binding protein n=1 Tax=Streptomyces longispororuber TaxID=68230 RepID=UPI0034094A5E
MITAQYQHRPLTGPGARPDTSPAPADSPGPATAAAVRTVPAVAAAAEEAVTTWPATAAAAPALRRFATASARTWRLEATACEVLALVVTELVTNVILHSGSPRVTLRLRLLPGLLRVEVHDTGCWHRRVTRRPARHTTGPDSGTPDSDAVDSALDDVVDGVVYAESGRGLALVRACAAYTTVRPSRKGTTVLAELALA